MLLASLKYCSEGKYVLVRLQSGEVRMILNFAVLQLVLSENEQHGLVNLGKGDVTAGKVFALQRFCNEPE